VSEHPGKDRQVSLEQNMSIILKGDEISGGPGRDLSIYEAAIATVLNCRRKQKNRK
jgi:hypothetical protein